MTYTVGEMSRLLGIPSSTIRYYDKEGLLPFVERTPGGNRIFREKDYEWLTLIECLKKANMSLKDIKKYIELLMQGDDTIPERLEMFRAQRQQLLAQMAELEKTLDVIDYKCWYYETAEKSGTTDVPRDMPYEQLPENLKHVYRELKSIPELN